MGKIPSRRVLSDDCVVRVGRQFDADSDPPEITNEGTAYNVHRGEWIEIVPVATMRESLAISQIARASSNGNGVGDAGPALEDLCSELAARLTGWTWTDLDGNPLPQPHGNPGVIKGLSTDEVFWLLGVTGGESEEAQGNAPTPSLGTSSIGEGVNPSHSRP